MRDYPGCAPSSYTACSPLAHRRRVAWRTPAGAARNGHPASRATTGPVRPDGEAPGTPGRGGAGAGRPSRCHGASAGSSGGAALAAYDSRVLRAHRRGRVSGPTDRGDGSGAARLWRCHGVGGAVVAGRAVVVTGTKHAGDAQRDVTLATMIHARAHPGVTFSEERLGPRELTMADGLPITTAVRSVCFEARYAPSLVAAVRVFDLAAYSDLVCVGGVCRLPRPPQRLDRCAAGPRGPSAVLRERVVADGIDMRLVWCREGGHDLPRVQCSRLRPRGTLHRHSGPIDLCHQRSTSNSSPLPGASSPPVHSPPPPHPPPPSLLVDLPCLLQPLPHEPISAERASRSPRCSRRSPTRCASGW